MISPLKLNVYQNGRSYGDEFVCHNVSKRKKLLSWVHKKAKRPRCIPVSDKGSLLVFLSNMSISTTVIQNVCCWDLFLVFILKQSFFSNYPPLFQRIIAKFSTVFVVKKIPRVSATLSRSQAPGSHKRDVGVSRIEYSEESECRLAETERAAAGASARYHTLMESFVVGNE